MPAPRSEWRAWALALTVAAVGLAVLVSVLAGALGQSRQSAPPPVLAVAATPSPAPPGATSAASPAGQIVSRPSAAEQSLEAGSLRADTVVHISRSWMEGFYPIYETAQRTFGVNWLLLASIHKQESAFSTAAGTYHGLNFAHCCGGPMQFNVTNGRAGVPSTWEEVSDSYIYGARPASYDHMTSAHPSIYDDFDAIMAAAHLLSVDGAEYALGESAWVAAYDYYGHDATGVLYADEVLARAIGWSQHGFCINCAISEPLLRAVHAAYGAPVLAGLEAEEVASQARARARAAATAPRPGSRTRAAAAGRGRS